MNNRIWLSSPHIGSSEKQYLEAFLEDDNLGIKRSAIEVFESYLENYLNKNKKVVALNSGTSALHLGLIMAGVKKKDVVICQSFTFAASANPILYQGATPVFIDSEPKTWNLCPVQLEKAIISEIIKGKKPKVIISVHSYGMPYMVDEIHAVAKKYEIPIIEDSASALGSTYKGQKCGTLGDFGIISFNENKIVTTFGGGALICNSIKTKNKSQFLAAQAKDKAPHYQHSEVGYNYKMSALNAAIGSGQLEVLEDHILSRRKMYFFYKELFESISDVYLFEEINDEFYSNHWLSAILLQNYKQRESLRQHLKKFNIESRPLWKPMHLQPVYEKYPYYGANVSEDLFERGLCLPSGSNLTNEDKERIKEVITLFFRELN